MNTLPGTKHLQELHLGKDMDKYICSKHGEVVPLMVFHAKEPLIPVCESCLLDDMVDMDMELEDVQLIEKGTQCAHRVVTQTWGDLGEDLRCEETKGLGECIRCGGYYCYRHMDISGYYCSGCARVTDVDEEEENLLEKELPDVQ